MREPNEPNHYDELKKAQEEALRKAEEALEQKRAQDEARRKADEQAREERVQAEARRKAEEQTLDQKKAQEATRQQEFQRNAEKLRTADAVEAHMQAFEKDLDRRVANNQITPHDRTYLLRQEDQRVANEIKKDTATREANPEAKIDTERMLTDRDYRREVEQQFKQEQARMLQRSDGRKM